MMKTISTILILVLSISCATKQEKQELTIRQKKAQLYYDRGTQLLVQQNYTEALDFLIKSVSFGPDRSDAQNNLGMAYYFKDRPEEAEKHLIKAIKLDPTNNDARNNLASLYFNQKHYGQAEKQYLEIINQLTYSKQFRVYYNLSLISIKKGDITQAKKYLELSLKEKSDYCVANLKLGQLQQNEANYQQALDHYKKARTGTCYNYPAPHYYLGSLYLQLGDVLSAQESFHTLTEKYPTSYFSKMAKLRLNELRDYQINPEKISQKNSNQPVSRQ